MLCVVLARVFTNICDVSCALNNSRGNVFSAGKSNPFLDERTTSENPFLEALRCFDASVSNSDAPGPAVAVFVERGAWSIDAKKCASVLRTGSSSLV